MKYSYGYQQLARKANSRRNFTLLDQYLFDNGLNADKTKTGARVQDEDGYGVTITTHKSILYGGAEYLFFTLTVDSIDDMDVTTHKMLDALWMAAHALVGVKA